MNFLPDIYVPCEVCEGKRYNRETLDVKYKGKSIFDVLDMTVDEALPFFEAIPSIRRKIETLHDVGLSYVKLGQPSTTLSGGEAQRIKLATELSRRSTGKTVYILDEPTTGQDEQSLAEIRRLLLAYKEQGGSIFICTHDMELAAQVADRVIVLCAGQIIADGTTEEVLSNKELVEAGGLTPSALLPVCEQAGIPPCITVEGVKRYVRKTAVGRN